MELALGTVVYHDFGAEVALTKTELAARLGCSKRHVEKLLAEGMPHTIHGRRKVFKETRVRNWLSERDRKEAAYARARS